MKNRNNHANFLSLSGTGAKPYLKLHMRNWTTRRSCWDIHDLLQWITKYLASDNNVSALCPFLNPTVIKQTKAACANLSNKKNKWDHIILHKFDWSWMTCHKILWPCSYQQPLGWSGAHIHHLGFNLDHNQLFMMSSVGGDVITSFKTTFIPHTPEQGQCTTRHLFF